MTRQTFKTQIVLWSRIGHTPITGRGGAYCDEVLRTTIDCVDSDDARAQTKRLINETPNAVNGCFFMPDHPNQNTRHAFI